MTVDVGLDHLAVACQVPHCKVTLFSSPLSICTLEESHSLRSGELHSRSLRAEYLHKLFQIFCMGTFDSSSPFICLSSYLFISEWIHGYLFYILGCIPISLNFGSQIVPASAIGSPFSWFPHSCA